MKVKIDVDECISKYFILAVDDEPRIEEIMGIQLQKGGYEYVSFHDPREAMEFVVGNHDLLDLAILDIKMPVMTGIEMANEIFKIESALPVILITGGSEDIEVRHTNNVKTLLHKPITKTELLDAVRESLYL